MTSRDSSGSTIDEVRAALNDLLNDDAAMVRIKKAADWRIWGLGAAAEYREGKDLIDQAVADILDGDRVWKKEKVDFCGYFLGVIRSIASHWKEQFAQEVVPFSALITVDADGNETSFGNTVPAPGPDPSRIVEAKQLVERIDELFVDDSLITGILGCLKAEMNGPETQAALNISQTDYETAMKRLRRKVRALVAD